MSTAKAKLFNLKKTSITGLCDAMRCTDPPANETVGDLWGRAEVKLCDGHMGQALAFAEQNPDYKHGDSPPPESNGKSNGATEPAAEPGTDIVVAAPAGVALPPTWLQRASANIAEIIGSQAEADEQLALAKGFVVDNQEDLQLVVDMAQEVKARRDRYEGLEKEITDPLNTIIKRVRTLIASAKTTWTTVESELRGIINKQKLLEENRNKQLMAEAAKLKEGGGDATATLQRMTTSTDLDGVSTKFVWNPVVVDIDKVPDPYVTRVADLKKLKAYAATFDGKEPEPVDGIRWEKDVRQRLAAAK